MCTVQLCKPEWRRIRRKNFNETLTEIRFVFYVNLFRRTSPYRARAKVGSSSRGESGSSRFATFLINALSVSPLNLTIEK